MGNAQNCIIFYNESLGATHATPAKNSRPEDNMFGSVNILKLVGYEWDLIEILNEFEDIDRKEKSLEKQCGMSKKEEI